MTALHPKHRVHFLGLNQPLPGTGVRMGDAAGLPRIMGIYGRGEKQASLKLSFAEQGN